MRFVVACLVAACALGPVVVRAQVAEPAVRLAIESMTDTTVTFRITDAKWIKAGIRGTIVDPRRHDALVGRIVVTNLASGAVVASIEGVTTNVSTDDVVIITRPPARWFRRSLFWVGLLVGGALGTAAGILSAGGS